ncbi:unnamed protein product [Closterium sp. NIES-53]
MRFPFGTECYRTPLDARPWAAAAAAAAVDPWDSGAASASSGASAAQSVAVLPAASGLDRVSVRWEEPPFVTSEKGCVAGWKQSERQGGTLRSEGGGGRRGRVGGGKKGESGGGEKGESGGGEKGHESLQRKGSAHCPFSGARQRYQGVQSGDEPMRFPFGTECYRTPLDARPWAAAAAAAAVDPWDSGAASASSGASAAQSVAVLPAASGLDRVSVRWEEPPLCSLESGF